MAITIIDELGAMPCGRRPGVAAMPVGLPGMVGPEYGRRKDSYDMLLLSMVAARVCFKPTVKGKL